MGQDVWQLAVQLPDQALTTSRQQRRLTCTWGWAGCVTPVPLCGRLAERDRLAPGFTRCSGILQKCHRGGEAWPLPGMEDKCPLLKPAAAACAVKLPPVLRPAGSREAGSRPGELEMLPWGLFLAAETWKAHSTPDSADNLRSRAANQLAEQQGSTRRAVKRTPQLDDCCVLVRVNHMVYLPAQQQCASLVPAGAVLGHLRC